METRNIIGGPSRDRIIQSFADAFNNAKTEIKFTIENDDKTTETYTGIIVKLEHEDSSGDHFNFAGQFENHGYIKGWYNSRKRNGFIITHS